MEKTLTKDQVVDKMMTSYTREELLEQCSESYRDFHGVRGRHMADWTHPELVSWWISMFDWDGRTQCWFPINGFMED